VSGSCEIVRYTPEHKHRLVELESKLWKADLPTSLRYLEWKYEQNPYLAEPLIYLAYAGERLVGARGFYGSRWEAGSGATRSTATIPVADDFIIVEDHRDRGLATRLMGAALDDLARQGHREVFNLSGSQVTVVASLAMGWKSAGPLLPVGIGPTETMRDRLNRSLRTTRLLWRLADRPWVLGGRDPFRKLDRAALRKPVILSREPDLDAMVRVVERIEPDGRIRHVRDREYFAWRLRNPLMSYRYLYYVNGSRLDGYLILKPPRPGGLDRAGIRLADLEAITPAGREALLTVAIESARSAGFHAWGATLPADALDRLERLGFAPVAASVRAHGCPCALQKTLVGGTGQLGGRRFAALSDWDLRMIDTMAG
jgi:GNAT superfamily N-acetyltransferase